MARSTCADKSRVVIGQTNPKNEKISTGQDEPTTEVRPGKPNFKHLYQQIFKIVVVAAVRIVHRNVFRITLISILLRHFFFFFISLTKQIKITNFKSTLCTV